MVVAVGPIRCRSDSRCFGSEHVMGALSEPRPPTGTRPVGASTTIRSRRALLHAGSPPGRSSPREPERTSTALESCEHARVDSAHTTGIRPPSMTLHHRLEALRTVLLTRDIRHSQAATEIFSTAPQPREARSRVTPAHGPDPSDLPPIRHPKTRLETGYRANAPVRPCRSGCFSTRGCRATPDQQGIGTQDESSP